MDSRLLLQYGHLHSVQQTVSDSQYEATCFSEQTKATGTQRLQYELVLHRLGHGSCTCPDFSNQGGACKHLCALQLLINDWVQRQLICPFYYPSSQSAASQLVYTPQSNTTNSTSIPPSFDNAIPSMLTSVLALCQLSGTNLPSKSWDSPGQDGMLSSSSEEGTDLEISEQNDILVSSITSIM